MAESALGVAKSAPTNAASTTAAFSRRPGLPRAPRSLPMHGNVSHPARFLKGNFRFSVHNGLRGDNHADRAGSGVRREARALPAPPGARVEHGRSGRALPRARGLARLG